MTQSRIERLGDGADADPLRPKPAVDVDWPRWTRHLDRRRRGFVVPLVWPGWVYRDGTRASFRLEGIDVTVEDVQTAVAAPRPLRSRHAGRLRNHIAILRALDRARARRRPLGVDDVVRWYTSISSGLSTTALSPAGGTRLTDVVRQINSPQRRLQPAVVEAARLYAELLSDPMFPGFNGILARLLLHAHLVHCGLPPVVFDAVRDAAPDGGATPYVGRLLEQIDVSLERLGASGNGTLA